MNKRELFNSNGFIHLPGFFDAESINEVRENAKGVFVKQMATQGLVGTDAVTDAEFESALYRFFERDQTGFVNCGKTCQHLISLHRLALNERILETLRELGVESPNIC